MAYCLAKIICTPVAWLSSVNWNQPCIGNVLMYMCVHTINANRTYPVYAAPPQCEIRYNANN